MVFLEHGGIVEAEAMVEATPTAHGVLLQNPQARRGLAGVRQADAAARQLLHQRRRGGGDPRQPHRQVQGGALPRHQGRGTARQLQQPLTGVDRLAIGHQQGELQLRIQQTEQGAHHHAPAKHPVLLGHPMGPARAARQGGGAEVTAAQVFCQPIPQLLLQLRREGKDGHGGGGLEGPSLPCRG